MLIDPGAAFACPAGAGTVALGTFAGTLAEGTGRFIGKRFDRIVVEEVRTDGQPVFLSLAVRADSGTVAEGTFAVGDMGADGAGGFVVAGATLFESGATEPRNDDKQNDD